MGFERAAWLGNVLLAGVAIYLAWVQVSEQMSLWVTVVVAVVVLVAVVALFPWRRADDGSTARLVNRFRTRVNGHHNPTMVAGERSNQIVNEGGGTFTINTDRER